MTFRVRDELRDAVEELAKANGRSLSEQVEYYVEAGIRSEAALIYQYSTDAMSPILFKAIAGRERGADGPGLDVSFPSGHREMLTIGGQTCLNQPAQPAVKISWPADFEEMRTLLCEAAREGAQQALTRYLFVEPGAKQARRKGGKGQSSTPDNPLSVEAIEAEFGRILGRSIPHSNTDGEASPTSNERRVASLLERLRFLAEGHGDRQAERLSQKHPRMPMPADLPSAESRGGGERSIAALRDLVVRFTDRQPDLEALRSAGWPARFDGLPTSTRTALIGELRDSASDVYQALMSPTHPRGEAVTALRRLQNVLLFRVDDEELDGDLGDVEGRSARARR